MLLDHIGLYFYPEAGFLRLAGRLCVPIWLFLIGYARGRRLDTVLFAGAVLVTLAQTALHQGFYTLNILWTIIALRLTLDPLMRWIGTSSNRLYGVMLLLFFFGLPTRLLLDYGSMAWILASWGYLVRNGFSRPAHTPAPPVSDVTQYGVLALMLFALTESVQFAFPVWQIPFLVAGCAALYPLLSLWLPRYGQHEAGGNWPVVLRRAVSFVGHHTLLIYVLHLLLFIGLALLSRIEH